MAVPSVQGEQEKTNQGQQGVWAQQASLQPSLHPMASGGSFPSMVVPPSSSADSVGAVKTKGITLNMGKLSLLAISLSLMFLGALTFLAGFLLGMWFASPQIPNVAMHPVQLPTYAQFQQNMASSPAVPPYVQGNAAAPDQTNLLSGITQAVAGQVGPSTTDAITNAQIPNVPDFLSPFVTASQSALGEQLGYKAQQQANRLNAGGEASSESSQTPPPGSKPGTPPPAPSSALPGASPSSHETPSTPSQIPVVGPQSHATSPTPPKTASASNVEDGDYTIQLGVYATEDNASALVNRLQGLNYISHLTEGKAPDGSKLYYVHTGLYKDYTSAVGVASQFASQNIPGAIVVKATQPEKTAS